MKSITPDGCGSTYPNRCSVSQKSKQGQTIRNKFEKGSQRLTEDCYQQGFGDLMMRQKKREFSCTQQEFIMKSITPDGCGSTYPNRCSVSQKSKQGQTIRNKFEKGSQRLTEDCYQQGFGDLMMRPKKREFSCTQQEFIMKNIIPNIVLAIALTGATMVAYAQKPQAADFDRPVQFLNLSKHQSEFIKSSEEFLKETELFESKSDPIHIRNIINNPQQGEAASLRRAINMQKQMNEHIGAINDSINRNAQLIGRIQQELLALQKSNGGPVALNKQQKPEEIENAMNRIHEEFSRKLSLEGDATVDEEVAKGVLSFRAHREFKRTLKKELEKVIGSISPEESVEDARKFIQYIQRTTNALVARKDVLVLLSEGMTTAFRRREIKVIEGLPDLEEPLYSLESIPTLVGIYGAVAGKKEQQPEAQEVDTDLYQKLFPKQ